MDGCYRPDDDCFASGRRLVVELNVRQWSYKHESITVSSVYVCCHAEFACQSVVFRVCSDQSASVSDLLTGLPRVSHITGRVALVLAMIYLSFSGCSDWESTFCPFK